MTEPTLDGIERALGVIRHYLPATPLLKSEILSRVFDADVWLKYETVTPIASFKIRGALNGMIHAQKVGATGAATSSTGNHGQGVAYAARLLNLNADIFLPCPANPVKAAMITAFGGNVLEVGSDIDEAKDAARESALRHEQVFLDDGDDVDIMEGAGTVALEILEALPNLDVLITALGGGNLTSGCATALKAVKPAAKIVSVQAAGSPAVTESFHARESLERPTDTIADGLVTRVPPRLALAMLWKYLDDAWLASDDELLAGVHTLAECVHTLVEPAGAAALAGAWNHREELVGKRIAMVLTGANITVPILARALATPPLFTLERMMK